MTKSQAIKEAMYRVDDMYGIPLTEQKEQFKITARDATRTHGVVLAADMENSS
jgi:hypothetical protein